MPDAGEYPLRPNHSRSVEIFGDFTDESGSRLLSQIAALRAASDAPITVYINSDGGSVRVLDILDGIMHSPDLDQKPFQFVAVAVGYAASAGADLLAFADYAYAHEHSVIHFHGVRTRELPDTFESASQTVNELQRINRRISRKLAESIIGRVIFRYQSLKSRLKPGKKLRTADGELAALHCFMHEIAARISPRARQLVFKTFGHVKKSHELERRILGQVVLTKGRNLAALAADDARVLQAVIKDELRRNKATGWRIDEQGINEIISDYFVLREYNIGDHVLLLRDLVGAFGRLFLSQQEITRYDAIKTATKKSQFLTKHAMPRLSPLWFFTVSLCRHLLEGENRLTPTDAYYLGIVDEVIGTKLTGRRVIAERMGDKKSKDTTASTLKA